jgi:hypothetical protein
MRTKLFAAVAAVQLFAFVQGARAEEPRINVQSLQGLTGLGVVVGALSEDAKKYILPTGICRISLNKNYGWPG